MGWHPRGVDAKRATGNYDIVKMETIKKKIQEGSNPLGCSVYSSIGNYTITVYDLFCYYRFTSTPYTMILMIGGKKNGRRIRESYRTRLTKSGK